MSEAVYLVSARRSAVVPRGGAFSGLDVDALAAPVLVSVLDSAGLPAARVDEIIVGNGLHGGGNPARRAALLAGLGEETPALTIDRQCCSGLDAIVLGARLIESGAADCILAGGAESYSRAPQRHAVDRDGAVSPQPYTRPPFTPWPERDPDMASAAAALAFEAGIDEARQAAWAVESHAKALRAEQMRRFFDELVDVPGGARDSYMRRLTPATCRRSRVLATKSGVPIRAATAAVSADAAAFVCLVSARLLRDLERERVCRFVAAASAGCDPGLPGLAPVVAGRKLAARSGIALNALCVSEVMEAYAAQAIACVEGLGLDPLAVNRSGGALARGHPIGASGAILAVRLFHELCREDEGRLGLAAIASAGGLGTAVLLQSARA
ncbi:thiolase family protein [Stappia sp. ES.058]|uniref:thiolase family protein n=1 Tax=Stappia sp. ES.058 TaxID=1881061 RepID=UPI0008793D01|nr:thiolase family protein [Stappia sp. ES.058]SDU37427.1 acetyl-CoA C-acetyltransferase [Stappia sp. ES.058]